jgi:RHS repeat-associated protein
LVLRLEAVMRSGFVTKHVLGLASALGLCLSGTMSAQALLFTDPPAANGGGAVASEDVATDPTGVDLVETDFTANSPFISIGGGAMSYGQIFDGDDWRHSIMGTISTTAVSKLLVDIMGQAEVFEYVALQWQPVRANGSSISFNATTQVYTYTSSMGVEAEFAVGLVGDAPMYGGDVANITYLLMPNGDRYDYHYNSTTITNTYDDIYGNPITETWDLSRLQSVTSNRGYQLHLEYGADTASTIFEGGVWMRADTATLINNAVDYCSPTAGVCPTFTEDWPALEMDDPTTTTRTYTNNDGEETLFRRNSNGDVTGIRYPDSTSDDITVNYSGSLVTSVVRGGVTQTYSRSDLSGTRTVTITDGASNATKVESSLATGLVTAVEDALGNRTTYLHDSDGRVTRVTAPEGNYVELTYDSRGNVTESRAVDKPTTPPEVSLPDLVTSATYPSSCSNPITCNQPTSTTDAAGNTTDYVYNATHGGVKTITAPAPSSGALRPQTRFTYSAQYAWYKNSSGTIVAGATPIYMLKRQSSCASGNSNTCAGTTGEVRYQATYGTHSVANNRQAVTSDIRDGTGTLLSRTNLTYDALGRVLTVEGPTSGTEDTTRIRYDAIGRVVGRIGPDPDGAGSLAHGASRTDYNDAGQVIQIDYGSVPSQSDLHWQNNFSRLQHQEFTYDSDGRVTHTRLVDGNGVTQALIQYSYDTAGRLDCTAQRMNPAYFASPPTSACTLGTQGSYGPDRITQNTFDALNRVVRVHTALGTSSEAEEMHRAFTDNGLVKYTEDGNDNRTAHIYDNFDRPLEIRYPMPGTDHSANTSDTEAWTYDTTTGRLATRTTRSGQVFSYTYDDLGRVTEVDTPSSVDATYTYNNYGQVLTLAEADTITNVYDVRGRLTSQTGAIGEVSYQYDAAGRRTRTDWDDSFYVTYDYNEVGAITAIRENGASSGAGVLATYAYDNYGRQTSMTRGNGVVTSYAFDAASRLETLTHNLTGTTNDQTLTMTHNPAGQIATRETSNDLYAWDNHVNMELLSGHNGLNQITSVTNYGATVTPPSWDTRGNMTSDGTNSYTYDHYNRLATAPGTTLEYDAMGRLFSEALTGSTTEFQYDGTSLIAEYNTSGVMQKRYVHGPGSDTPIVEYSGSGTSSRTWLLTDERGSITARTDSTGAATAINSYDEYGNPDASNVGRFGYTGQIWLEDAGVWHYKARAYHPGLGRFMQTDPIGQAGGMNIYAYVGGDPVNMVDPSGLLSCIVNGNNQGDCRYRRYSSGLGGLYSGFTSSFSRIGVDISGLDPLAGGPNFRAGRDSEGGEPSCDQDLVNYGNYLADSSIGLSQFGTAMAIAGTGALVFGASAAVVPLFLGASIVGITAGLLHIGSGIAHQQGGASGANIDTGLAMVGTAGVLGVGVTISRAFRESGRALSAFTRRVDSSVDNMVGSLGIPIDVMGAAEMLTPQHQHCSAAGGVQAS